MEKKPIILVLDDNDDVVQVLTTLLESSGYNPRPAHDGREALEIIEQERPPVGIIDLMLPGMNGLEVMEEIGKKSPDTECIVLTAFASSDSAIRAINLGAYSYLTKPYDVDQLLLTVQRAFEKHETDLAFRNSEQKYRALFENAHEAIVLSDYNTGQVLDLNKEAERLLDITRKELLGSHRADLYPKEMRNEYEEEFLDHVDTDRPGDFEAEIVLRDGKQIPVKVRTMSTKLGERKVIQSIIWDATEQKRVEKAITEIVSGDAKIKNFLVGREMKIIELKKEVNVLRRESGKEQKYKEESSVVEGSKK